MEKDERKENGNTEDSDQRLEKSDFSDAAKAAAENVRKISSISEQLGTHLRGQLQSVTSSMHQTGHGLKKQIETIERANHLYAESFAELAEEVAAQQREIQTAFASLGRLPLNDFARQVEITNAQFAETLSSLSIDIARSLGGFDISAFREALQQELQEHREGTEQTAVDESVGDFIIQFYFGAFQRLPSSTVTKEAILIMILTVILTVYQAESSSDDARRIIDSLQEVEKVIQKEQLSSSDAGSQKFTVTTDLNLRTQPSTEAPIEMVIGYNQIVEIIKQKKDWAYVTFYDNVEDVPRVGWVHMKYLDKIEGLE